MSSCHLPKDFGGRPSSIREPAFVGRIGEKVYPIQYQAPMWSQDSKPYGKPILEMRHHPGQSLSLDTNQQMRCACRIAETMANYASKDEHRMVISVCAYMTDSISTVGATNSERASSTPRVWYDDIFARCCSETTVIGGMLHVWAQNSYAVPLYDTSFGGRL